MSSEKYENAILQWEIIPKSNFRLMMRRCMESGNCQFGMVLSPDSKYGTMLRINSFNQMPDGR